MDADRTKPHDEARLVQADDGALRLIEGEESDASAEERERRERDDGRHERSEREV